ncbi:hypothetical protein ABU614_02915 [Lysobacter firmicutimachus]|uniref:AfsR-like transcriptional regulator n=1 Tax=Lysobacter firmicutimachus TaxID=1792846 RepID=A0AAU8MTI4_9GAMM
MNAMFAERNREPAAEALPALPAPIAATLQRLSRVLPGPAAAAEVLLARTLAPLSRSIWPEVAWDFSDLTNTGVPVEFSWSSREPCLRWAAEVAAPETDDRARLALAARALDWQGDLSAWFEHQRHGRLIFGAWASARHGDGSLATKLYVDLPGGRLPPQWSERHAWFRSPLLVWRLCGVNPDGSTEFYARAHELDRLRLATMAQAALGDAGPLMRQLDALLSGAELPRPSGLSLVLSAQGEPLALSWFVIAKAVFRDDAEAGACLQRCGDETTVPVHRALAGGPEDGRWRHGVMGVVADVTGRSWVQCSLRPT